jgi:hypothetical protein
MTFNKVDVLRINKDNEMANMMRKEQRLVTENKKLKAELLLVQVHVQFELNHLSSL